MQTDALIAISPLDGRYAAQLKSLQNYFSEYALIRYRVFVEIEWLIFLCNEVKLEGTRKLSEKELKICRGLSTDFEAVDAKRVKEFEAKTNHDVKAVEYFIQEHLKAYGKLAALIPFIHFGCTSEDINNVAYSLLLKDFSKKELLPMLSAVSSDLMRFGQKYNSVPMLARTHGQAASPTTLGKEFMNFAARLRGQIELFEAVPRYAKWNGATGNFNAHAAAYPGIDWPSVSVRFISYLGLTPNLLTTQIEPHDMLAAIFDALRRINTILVALCSDVWWYISLGYLTQAVVKGEVGSSTMPHKVNPIDFENAEGNLGVANALLQHFSAKLPISRMQRDLSDSTVMRNIGTAFGYSFLAYRSLLRGMKKIGIDEEVIRTNLKDRWELLAEAVQSVLRKNGVSDAYEQLKKLSRGEQITQASLKKFIQALKIPAADKKRLTQLTPEKYIGYAPELVRSALKTYDPL